jgi:hypothetical protein
MGHKYKKLEDKTSRFFKMRSRRQDDTVMEFIRSRLGLISDADAVRFALNFTAKNLRL